MRDAEEDSKGSGISSALDLAFFTRFVHSMVGAPCGMSIAFSDIELASNVIGPSKFHL